MEPTIYTPTEEIIQREDVLYVFELSKIPSFMAALNSLPEDEVGALQTYNAVRRTAVLADVSGQKLYDMQSVFCLVTDFREEHAALRAAAEAESLFYYPVYEEDKRMINYFFAAPEDLTASEKNELDGYLVGIGKGVADGSI